MKKTLTFDDRKRRFEDVVKHLVISQLRKKYKTPDEAIEAKLDRKLETRLEFRNACHVDWKILKPLSTITDGKRIFAKLVEASGFKFHQPAHKQWKKTNRHFTWWSWFEFSDDQIRAWWEDYANAKSPAFTKQVHKWIDKHVYYKKPAARKKPEQKHEPKREPRQKEEKEHMSKDPVWMGGVEKHAVPPLKIEKEPPAHPADDIPDRNAWEEPREVDELRAKARDEMKKLYRAGLMGPAWAKTWKGILGATNLPGPAREFDPQSAYWREYGRFALALANWIKAGHSPDRKTALAGTGMTEEQLIVHTLRSYKEAAEAAKAAS